MDHGDYDKYGICHSLHFPLAASAFVCRVAGMEAGEDAVPLTVVDSALTAVQLSGAVDQL